MPFGQHKGKPLSELPENYFFWLLSIVLREPLLSAVKEEADRRHHAAIAKVKFDAVWALAIVAAGVKVLARKHHPDVGGSNETMALINHAADWLRGTAERQGVEDN